jgi:hypothetical protein
MKLTVALSGAAGLTSAISRVTRVGEFLPIGRLFTLGSGLKITEEYIFGLLFPRYLLHTYVFILSKNGFGSVLGDFFTNSSGHPGYKAQEPRLMAGGSFPFFSSDLMLFLLAPNCELNSVNFYEISVLSLEDSPLGLHSTPHPSRGTVAGLFFKVESFIQLKIFFESKTLSRFKTLNSICQHTTDISVHSVCFIFAKIGRVLICLVPLCTQNYMYVT